MLSKKVKRDFQNFIKQNKNLPDYFVSLILWKLRNENVTSFWIKKMTEQIKYIQNFL